MYTYKFRKNTTTSEKTPRIQIQYAQPSHGSSKNLQATDLSHALGLVSWLPRTVDSWWLGEHVISLFEIPKRMIIAQRFHDGLVFSRKHCWIFLECLGRVRLIHHFLFYRYSLKRLWFLLHVFGGPADWCLVDSCYSWGRNSNRCPWIFVVGRGSHLKFVRWFRLPMLQLDGVVIGLLAQVVVRLLD